MLLYCCVLLLVLLCSLCVTILRVTASIRLFCTATALSHCQSIFHCRYCCIVSDTYTPPPPYIYTRNHTHRCSVVGVVVVLNALIVIRIVTYTIVSLVVCYIVLLVFTCVFLSLLLLLLPLSLPCFCLCSQCSCVCYCCSRFCIFCCYCWYTVAVCVMIVVRCCIRLV